jgi:DNA-binding MarR family transcriptional regulator
LKTDAKSVKNKNFQIVLDTIRKIIRSVRLSSRTTEKNVGLSTAQIFVLQKLAQKPTMTVNELAEATFTHQSSVSVVISKLVDRKLVERGASATDGRSHELKITSQGTYLLSKSPGSIQDRLFDGFSQMSEDEQIALVDSLTKLLRNSGLEEEKVPMLLEELAEEAEE